MEYKVKALNAYRSQGFSSESMCFMMKQCA